MDLQCILNGCPDFTQCSCHDEFVAAQKAGRIPYPDQDEPISTDISWIIENNLCRSFDLLAPARIHLYHSNAWKCPAHSMMMRILPYSNLMRYLYSEIERNEWMWPYLIYQYRKFNRPMPLPLHDTPIIMKLIAYALKHRVFVGYTNNDEYEDGDANNTRLMTMCIRQSNVDVLIEMHHAGLFIDKKRLNGSFVIEMLSSNTLDNLCKMTQHDMISPFALHGAQYLLHWLSNVSLPLHVQYYNCLYESAMNWTPRRHHLFVPIVRGILRTTLLLLKRLMPTLCRDVRLLVVKYVAMEEAQLVIDGIYTPEECHQCRRQNKAQCLVHV